MDQRTQLRLEALRLAEGLIGGNHGPDHVVNCANRFYQFLTGEDEKGREETRKELMDMIHSTESPSISSLKERLDAPSFDDGLPSPDPAQDELRDYAEDDDELTLYWLNAVPFPRPFNPNAAAAQTEERFDILGDPRMGPFTRAYVNGYWNI